MLNNNLVAGKFNADGDLSQGGNIDFSGYNVMVAAADISAKGSNQGGKVRIGGEYLGAKSCQRLVRKNIMDLLIGLVIKVILIMLRTPLSTTM